MGGSGGASCCCGCCRDLPDDLTATLYIPAVPSLHLTQLNLRKQDAFGEVGLGCAPDHDRQGIIWEGQVDDPEKCDQPIIVHMYCRIDGTAPGGFVYCAKICCGASPIEDTGANNTASICVEVLTEEDADIDSSSSSSSSSTATSAGQVAGYFVCGGPPGDPPPNGMVVEGGGFWAKFPFTIPCCNPCCSNLDRTTGSVSFYSDFIIVWRNPCFTYGRSPDGVYELAPCVTARVGIACEEADWPWTPQQTPADGCVMFGTFDSFISGFEAYCDDVQVKFMFYCVQIEDEHHWCMELKCSTDGFVETHTACVGPTQWKCNEHGDPGTCGFEIYRNWVLSWCGNTTLPVLCDSYCLDSVDPGSIDWVRSLTEFWAFFDIEVPCCPCDPCPENCCFDGDTIQACWSLPNCDLNLTCLTLTKTCTAPLPTTSQPPANGCVWVGVQDVTAYCPGAASEIELRMFCIGNEWLIDIYCDGVLSQTLSTADPGSFFTCDPLQFFFAGPGLPSNCCIGCDGGLCVTLGGGVGCIVEVDCCPDTLPSVLTATIEDNTNCGCAIGTITLNWNSAQSMWEGVGTICSEVWGIGVFCGMGGTSCLNLRIGGPSSDIPAVSYSCTFGFASGNDPIPCSCDPLELVYTNVLVTAGGGPDPCCNGGATPRSVNVTITA